MAHTNISIIIYAGDFHVAFQPQSNVDVQAALER